MTSSYVHGLFTIVLIKQIFEKNKSSRSVPGNWTQFKPEISPDYDNDTDSEICRFTEKTKS